MRALLCLATFSLLAACTNHRIIRHEAAPGGETTGEPGDGDSPSTEACVAAGAAPVLSAKILGRASVDFAGAHLGFGYVDPRGVPTVESHDVITGETATAEWTTAPVRYAHYGAGYISTSLAHNGDRFGFGWYTERAYSGTEGVWSTRFATVSAAGAKKSAAARGNDDNGRHGSTDMVQAIRPTVMPFADGFLMAWDDTRDKEPVVYNVNLAYWGGIYGRVYDADGKGASRDVQIAQPTGADAVSGVTDGTRVMPIWVTNDGRFHSQIHARSGSEFSPAEAPEPVATFDSQDTARLAAARGEDGDVLVVVQRSEVARTPLLGSMLLTMAGKAKTDLADWKETGLGAPAVVATGEGYVVAAYEMREDAAVALRFFWLDAEGARVGEARSELSLPEGVELGAPALRSSGATVQAAFVTTAGERTSDAAEAKVHLLTVCAPNPE